MSNPTSFLESPVIRQIVLNEKWRDEEKQSRSLSLVGRAARQDANNLILQNERQLNEAFLRAIAQTRVEQNEQFAPGLLFGCSVESRASRRVRFTQLRPLGHEADFGELI